MVWQLCCHNQSHFWPGIPNVARRRKLALKFAQKTVKKSRHSDMFVKLENPHQGRAGIRREWREPPCKRRRHLKSAVPYLTRLLNGEKSWEIINVIFTLLYLVREGCEKKKPEKCGLLPNSPRTPSPSLAFFQPKKFTPIFFVEYCIFNGRNEFYAWSHFKNK